MAFRLRVTAISAMLAVTLYAQNARTIPDVPLINQHGQKVRFYSDLIKGKVVAVNTIFTSCTTICPVMGANFATLPNTFRKMFGDEESRNVHLISISVDPLADTPERLDQWSHKFRQPGPGWTLLTGPKVDVDRVLKALQIYRPDKQQHEPVVLIGGDTGGDWIRASALKPPADLAKLIHARLMGYGSN